MKSNNWVWIEIIHTCLFYPISIDHVEQDQLQNQDVLFSWKKPPSKTQPKPQQQHRPKSVNCSQCFDSPTKQQTLKTLNPNLNSNNKLTPIITNWTWKTKPYQKLRHWDGSNKLMMKLGDGSDTVLFELLSACKNFSGNPICDAKAMDSCCSGGGRGGTRLQFCSSF